MKLLAKIASSFNFRALIFKIFLWPHTHLEGVCAAKSNNIFHCYSFRWAPLKFFVLLRPCAVSQTTATSPYKLLSNEPL